MVSLTSFLKEANPQLGLCQLEVETISGKSGWPECQSSPESHFSRQEFSKLSWLEFDSELPLHGGSVSLPSLGTTAYPAV